MTLNEWLGLKPDETNLGVDIWKNKYCYNNESFEDWINRVSANNENIKKLILEKKFLFGGRILANRGLEKMGKKITFSNCYVIAQPEDNIESIFETAKKLARTYSYGGGCGIDISKLSPKGAKVNNAARETSGSVSFMDLYSVVTGLIGQNGRRGALMISMSCDHPDIEEFIHIKSDLDRVTKANISLRITDDFMKAVKEKKPFKLTFTREETGEVIEKEVDAQSLFTEFCKMNWDYAEPGMLFWDRIKNYNILSEDSTFEYAGTNPCAEEPLPAGGSCLLGSINLSEFVIEDKKTFDIDAFREAVNTAVIGLNEVLDEGLPLHPLQEQRDSVKLWRQIGLGIFGLADMLIKMKITYGSPESLKLCDEIAFAMADEAIATSARLAKEYEPYPNYHKESIMKSDFLLNNTTKETKALVEQYGLRNSQLLTCAPTGSLSSMLGVSGGIEPIFANYYTRKTESLKGHDEYYKVWTPIVKKYVDKNNIEKEEELPEYFITAPKLNYMNRIDMQAVWQEHIDASISSTINLDNSATVKDVQELYQYAWEAGLKGVTIFRDGCARIGILTTTENKDSVELKRGQVIKTNEKCVGKKRTLITGCGTLHCEAFFDSKTGELMETYFSKGSKGGCNSFMVGLSRMISLAARGGINIYAIVDQLKSTLTCPSYAVRAATKKDTSHGTSCPSAIGKVLLDMYNEMQLELGFELKSNALTEKTSITDVGDGFSTCPVCGSELIQSGGCRSCNECGWTKCD